MNDIKEEEDFTQELSFQLKCSSFTSSMHSLVRTAKSLDTYKTISVLKIGGILFYWTGEQEDNGEGRDSINYFNIKFPLQSEGLVKTTTYWNFFCEI